MFKMMLNRKSETSTRPRRRQARGRAGGLLRLGFVIALLLSAAACRGDESGDPTEVTTPAAVAPTVSGEGTADVADLVATAVAATVTAQPSPAPPTSTPPPARHPLVGRWQHEHAEEGLNYIELFEFFADGLYTVQVKGSMSYCYVFPDFPGCEFLPDIPIDESASGSYEFLSDTQVRLRDTTGQLSAFTIVELTPSRLVTLDNDGQHIYERGQ